jgi:hypothetical protein
MTEVRDVLALPVRFNASEDCLYDANDNVIFSEGELAVDGFTIAIAINSYDSNQELIKKQKEQIEILEKEKQTRCDVLKTHVHIDANEFSHLAALVMCNDQASDNYNIDIINGVMDQIAINCLGFDDRISAYHTLVTV